MAVSGVFSEMPQFIDGLAGAVVDAHEEGLHAVGVEPALARPVPGDVDGQARNVRAAAGGAGEEGTIGRRRTRVTGTVGGVPGRRAADVLNDGGGPDEEPDEPGAARGRVGLVQESPVALEDEARHRRRDRGVDEAAGLHDGEAVVVVAKDGHRGLHAVGEAAPLARVHHHVRAEPARGVVDPLHHVLEGVRVRGRRGASQQTAGRELGRLRAGPRRAGRREERGNAQDEDSAFRTHSRQVLPGTRSWRC